MVQRGYAVKNGGPRGAGFILGQKSEVTGFFFAKSLQQINGVGDASQGSMVRGDEEGGSGVWIESLNLLTLRPCSPEATQAVHGDGAGADKFEHRTGRGIQEWRIIPTLDSGNRSVNIVAVK